MRHLPAEPAAWGLFAASLVGSAVHWFLTPMRHPNAPVWVTLLHALQVIVGIGVGFGARRLSRSAHTAVLED